MGEMMTTLTKYWRSALLICSPLFLSLSVSAQTYHSAFETNQAYQKLTHAAIFNVGGAGFGSQITEEEKAFRIVFESPDSTRLFRQLIDDANAEGLLFALLGLHLRDSEAFDFEAARLEINGGASERVHGKIALLKGQAQVGRGCFIWFADIHTVVGQIANREWDGLVQQSSRWPNLDTASR